MYKIQFWKDNIPFKYTYKVYFLFMGSSPSYCKEQEIFTREKLIIVDEGIISVEPEAAEKNEIALFIGKNTLKINKNYKLS